MVVGPESFIAYMFNPEKTKSGRFILFVPETHERERDSQAECYRTEPTLAQRHKISGRNEDGGEDERFKTSFNHFIDRVKSLCVELLPRDDGLILA